MSEEKIILTKTHTREHPIFYAFIYYESDFRHIVELWGYNLRNFVILKDNTNKLEIWNDPIELDNLYVWVTEQLNKGPKFLTLALNRFYQYLDPMLPYLNQEKKIQNIKELKEYYNNWLHWWSPMDSVFLIPEMQNAPEDAKKVTLAIREKTHQYTDILDKVFVEFFQEKFPEYKQYVDVILPEEVFSLEEGKLTQEKINELENRKLGCAVFRGEILSLQELQKVFEENNIFLQEDKIEVKKKLRGSCACRGFAKGKAKLVLHREDLSKIELGDVIISSMTSPDFVIAMEKASAIITDEGGISCHAAIVARELNKPCVVGTKIATQILKDYDEIEVDATNGIIKILS